MDPVPRLDGGSATGKSGLDGAPASGAPSWARRPLVEADDGRS